jgi:hypothetical protein
MVGVKMAIKNVALINANDQVVNIVIVDVEDEVTMVGLHEQWGTVRWVEFDHDADDIILDPSPEVWTTHTEETGFEIPESYKTVTVVIEDAENTEETTPVEEVTINGRVYPKDSLLIKENASRRPEGWVFPDGETEVSLSDAD